MPLTLDLPPETHAALADFAQRRGVTAEQLAASVLRLHFPPPQPPPPPDPEWEAAFIRRTEEWRRNCPPPQIEPPTGNWDEVMQTMRELDEAYFRETGETPADDEPAEPAAWEANEKRLERLAASEPRRPDPLAKP